MLGTYNRQLPFGMLHIDKVTPSERGYEGYITDWKYNPKEQTTNLVHMGGPSEKETMCPCATYCGVFANTDDNEMQTDDKA